MRRSLERAENARLRGAARRVPIHTGMGGMEAMRMSTFHDQPA